MSSEQAKGSQTSLSAAHTPAMMSEKNANTPPRSLEGDAADRLTQAQEDSQASPRNLKGIKWILCVLSIYAAVFLYALDNTIVATIQPAIIDSFGHLEKLPWVSVTYQVTSVALDLTWGKFYAKFNGKTLFIIAIIFFEIGSAICGAAPNMNAEIVGRAVCGVGGIGVYIGALNLLAVSTTAAERPVYVAMMGICWGSGTVLGPVIGGAFTDSSASWRWSFYINLVVGGAAAPAWLLLLPSTNTHLREVKLATRLKTIDWVGTILIAGATVSGVMGINFGGTLYPWGSGQIIGCFVCSVVCWILFVLQQIYAVFTTKEDRIFPCDIVLRWEADVLFILTATGLGASIVTIYFIPLYYQFVQGEQALDAGVRLLPMMFLMILASNIAGAALGRGLWFMPFALAGCLLVVVGGALMYSLVQVDTRGSLIYGFSVLIGFGAGLYTQGPISVVQSLVSPNRVAEATAFVAFGQVVGITIMLAVANAVFLNRATIVVERLLPNVPLKQIQAAIQGISTDVLSNLPGDLRRQIQAGVVASMNDVYILVFVAGAVGVILCPFVKRTKKA